LKLRALGRDELLAMLKVAAEAEVSRFELRVGDIHLRLTRRGGPPPQPLIEVNAPTLGVFRSGAAPVRAGDRVEAGAVLARIDVLDASQTVVAGTGGTVAAVLVADGAFVQYGQTLFRLRAD